MGTPRSVGIRVPSKCTRYRPAGRGPASGECAWGGACCPGSVPPVAPWNSVVPGTAPHAGIFTGMPGTNGSRGRQAMRPAGPPRSVDAPSGVGTPTTASSPTTSVSPPRLAQRCIGKNHIPEIVVEPRVRGRGRGVTGWDGARPAPPPRTRPFPWGPPLGIPEISLPRPAFQVSLHRCVRGVPWARASGGSPACAGAAVRARAAFRAFKSSRNAEAGGPIDKGLGLAAEGLAGAITGSPVGLKRCTYRQRSNFPVRFTSCGLSVWRWAGMSKVPGSRPRGSSSNRRSSVRW